MRRPCVEGEALMQEVVDRVMQTYGLMVTLSPEEQAEARERLREHLNGMQGDENALAVAGLRFLRNPRPPRGRRNECR